MKRMTFLYRRLPKKDWFDSFTHGLCHAALSIMHEGSLSVFLVIFFLYYLCSQTKSFHHLSSLIPSSLLVRQFHYVCAFFKALETDLCQTK